MTYKDYQDELYHFGIKGMRWGVRRYQNPDGSMTAEGVKRRRNTISGDKIVMQEGSNIAGRAGNISRSAERIKKERAGKVDLKKMSDQDLQKAVNRMNLERNYNNLKYEKINAGKVRASDVLGVIGDVLAIGASAATIALAYNNLLKTK